MSFTTDIRNIFGFWENDNFPPFAYNDKLRISLMIKNQDYTSLVTIKDGDIYTNYALKFISIQTNSIDNATINFKIINGDNIDEKLIGSELSFDLTIFLGSPRADTLVCSSKIFNKRLLNVEINKKTAANIVLAKCERRQN